VSAVTCAVLGNVEISSSDATCFFQNFCESTLPADKHTVSSLVADNLDNVVRLGCKVGNTSYFVSSAADVKSCRCICGCDLACSSSEYRRSTLKPGARNRVSTQRDRKQLITTATFRDGPAQTQPDEVEPEWLCAQRRVQLCKTVNSFENWPKCASPRHVNARRPKSYLDSSGRCVE
jgi:hypothetical protein